MTRLGKQAWAGHSFERLLRQLDYCIYSMYYAFISFIFRPMINEISIRYIHKSLNNTLYTTMVYVALNFGSGILPSFTKLLPGF